jgi:hypothetical protein
MALKSARTLLYSMTVAGKSAGQLQVPYRTAADKSEVSPHTLASCFLSLL